MTVAPPDCAKTLASPRPSKQPALARNRLTIPNTEHIKLQAVEQCAAKLAHADKKKCAAA